MLDNVDPGWLWAIGDFANSPNSKTILFPVEATQLIGTLGGIGELARDALGQSGGSGGGSGGSGGGSASVPTTRGPFEGGR